mmetsp:Transcript_70059/g.193813  ORF Transcript_70059/g.193813 Transcript_70059/m.193813 type:complete len:208 (+) Transcript_70059:674-1297(+)
MEARVPPVEAILKPPGAGSEVQWSGLQHDGGHRVQIQQLPGELALAARDVQEARALTQAVDTVGVEEPAAENRGAAVVPDAVAPPLAPVCHLGIGLRAADARALRRGCGSLGGVGKEALRAVLASARARQVLADRDRRGLAAAELHGASVVQPFEARPAAPLAGLLDGVHEIPGADLAAAAAAVRRQPGARKPWLRRLRDIHGVGAT